MKYISLVTLTVQNAALGLSMRYARTRVGDMFLSSTGNFLIHRLPFGFSPNKLLKYFYLFYSVSFHVAVLMSEFVKLISCLWLVYHEEGNSLMKLKEAINIQIIKQPLDTLKVCVPSMVYVVQNNLLYVAASHLDAATYQVPREEATH